MPPLREVLIPAYFAKNPYFRAKYLNRAAPGSRPPRRKQSMRCGQKLYFRIFLAAILYLRPLSIHKIMNSTVLKKALPHVIAILVFLIVAVVYCRPALEGKVVAQQDMLQYK